MRVSGAWDLGQIERYLDGTVIPVRLACCSKRMSPSVVSLWFLYSDQILWCATQQSAKTVSILRENPKCGFEIAGEQQPYRGVRGQGVARIDAEQGPAVLERLILRYLGDGNESLARWLRSRSSSEVAVAIRPSNLYSWDYSRRMRSESE